ncbi:hypothetical protein TrVE_jg3143 [Triparma verrucosa]|uniref:SET domain-containing protein n=1 Tax=Triparma verrucosa TaxID=1606542 RepID=A0A9W7ESK6_9STRA|nr:hypothetical protein TrVE_jg3143 [Triparma verrucosa]
MLFKQFIPSFLRPVLLQKPPFTSSQILRLLNPSLPPPCYTSNSLTPDAGLGVFASSSHPPHTPLCLYAGVHHPAPPLTTTPGTDYSFPPTLLGPLGKSVYGINCPEIGGVLDYITPGQTPPKWHSDSNPNAIGQFINHSPSRSSECNVYPVSFLWSSLPIHKSKISRYTIPNYTSRNCEWYYDPSSDIKVSRSSRTIEEEDDEGEISERECGGIVFVTNREIEEGEELRFDYNLGKREDELPDWYVR